MFIYAERHNITEKKAHELEIARERGKLARVDELKPSDERRPTDPQDPNAYLQREIEARKASAILEDV